jgi:drug/metabolite transporter (DMT)-like permease
MVDALLPIHEPEPPGGLPRRQPPDQRPGRGYALVVLAASCFIVNAGVARVAMDAGVPADRLAGLRSVGTAAALLLIVVALRRVRTLRVSLTEVPWLLLYGVVGVALLQVSYFVAIHRLPVGIALLLEYLAPVLIALWAWLVQRRPVRARLWPALALALVGLALVTKLWDAGALDPFGVAMGLTAAVCFSTYFLAGEHLVRHRDVLSVVFWGFAISGVFWSLVRPWWTFDAEVLSATTEVFGDVVTPVWVLVLWVVLLGTLVPYGADTAALRYLPATIVSLIAMLEPVGAAALAWVWFGESLAAVQILGGLTVIVGIVLAQTSRPTATD